MEAIDPETGETGLVDNGILEFCGEVCAEPDPFFLGRAIERYQSAEVQLSRYSPELHDYFPIPFNENNFNQALN